MVIRGSFRGLEDVMGPIKNAWRWKRWSITGREDDISKTMSNLDANLPSGWRRLTEDELLPFGSLVRPGSGWYGLGPDPSCGNIALSVERPAPHQLRGGWVRSSVGFWFAYSNEVPATMGQMAPFRDEGVTPPENVAAWDEVGRFLDEGVIPAARAAGAEIRVPPPEEMFLSELPFEVGDRLRSFSEAARKSLPLESKEAELWRAFVVAVFRMEARFDIEPFVDWMAAVGWPRELAAELYSQLVDDCLLLSQYADEVSAA
jgi:hypothetical protein